MNAKHEMRNKFYCFAQKLLKENQDFQNQCLINYHPVAPCLKLPSASVK